MSYNISFFKSIADKSPSEIAVLRLLEGIKTGEFRQKVDQLRNEPDPALKDKIKKSLETVTISGVFRAGHKFGNLVDHSGLIQIDLDKVENVLDVKKQLESDKYSFAVFISPSGYGIKVIVKIHPGTSTHIPQFKELEQYYLNTYNLTVDPQCKNVNRLMYVSFDETLFHNPDSLQWVNDGETQFGEALILTSKFGAFVEGKRNDFVYKLACNCRGMEISFDSALQNIINRYETETFTKTEIFNTVRSAYNKEENKTGSIVQNKVAGQSLFARVENYLTARYDIRFNVVSAKVEYRLRDSNDDFIELNENTLLRELYHNNLELSTTKLFALLGSDYAANYNPFVDYFENLSQWNSETEIDFIDKLSTYIPVKDTERFKVQFKKMLVRSIACALDDKVFNKQVFVFVHDMQNSGKSTFCRWLCPPKLSNYITENINTDKDSLIALSTNIIINMDELATLSKAEINTLKSFISKDRINVRLPYGRKATVLPRRANFIGSTNKDEFLTDETGSVRWLCFELTEKINFSYKSDLNIDDIYRQAYTLYKNDFEYQLTPKEIEENEEANSHYQQRTPEMELIQKYFTPASKNDPLAEALTATDILEKLHKKTTILNNSSSQKIGKALAELCFEKVTERLGESKMPTKIYWVIFTEQSL